MSCDASKEGEKYPFRDISESILELQQSINDNPKLANDRDYLKNYKDKNNSIAKKLLGKNILTEIDKGLGLEVVDMGIIGEGKTNGTMLEMVVNFNLKIVDADAAFRNIDNLAVVFYDNTGVAVYVEPYVGDEQSLKVDEGKRVNPDSVEIILKDSASENPYNVGQVLHKGIFISLFYSDILPFVNISKMVIKRYDSDIVNEIEKNIR